MLSLSQDVHQCSSTLPCLVSINFVTFQFSRKLTRFHFCAQPILAPIHILAHTYPCTQPILASSTSLCFFKNKDKNQLWYGKWKLFETKREPLGSRFVSMSFQVDTVHLGSGQPLGNPNSFCFPPYKLVHRPDRQTASETARVSRIRYTHLTQTLSSPRAHRTGSAILWTRKWHVLLSIHIVIPYTPRGSTPQQSPSTTRSTCGSSSSYSGLRILIHWSILFVIVKWKYNL